jgi:hypothetical protein
VSNDYFVRTSTPGKRDTDIEGGAAALSDATPAALGTAAAGTGEAASREDHVHAMPTGAALLALVDAARVTTPSMASEVAGGWTPTLVTAPGQVTVTGGELVVSYSGASTTSGAGGYEESAWPAAVGAEYEIRARARITNTTSADSRLYGNVLYGAGLIYWIVRGDGITKFCANLASENAQLGADVTLPVDGTGWVRFRVRGGRLTYWTGVGVGTAEPTSWTLRYDGDRTQLVGLAVPTGTQWGGSQTSTASVGATVTYRWSHLTLRNLGSGG